MTQPANMSSSDQEIVDKLDSSLSFSQPIRRKDPSAAAAAAAAAPATAPTPASTAETAAPKKPLIGPEAPPRKTVDEVYEDFQKSPLFMKELDEDNDDIAALQAIAYEGTPLENATDFKDRGNECFAERNPRNAVEFYGNGVSIIWHEERKRRRGQVTMAEKEGVPDTAEDIASQKKLLEVLYVNRAACHLELKNYRSCWLDCAAALRLNPANQKAWYRSARALLRVDRVGEADEACARGLALDAGNKALAALAGEIVERHRSLERVRAAREEREARERRKAQVLAAAIKARGVRMRKTEKPPEMEDARVRLVPDEEDPRSTLAFPVVLFYPLHFETDFVKAFNETETLEDHLGYVFPLPWDTKKEYALGRVACYVETVTGGLMKMGRKVPLWKVLGGGKVEVVDQVVRIFVVPEAGAEGWVQTFKKQKAEEGEKP